MSRESIRPRADQLILNLYDRALHPELLTVVTGHRLRTDAGWLHVRILPAGHAVSLEEPGVHLTELAAGEDQPAPLAGRLIRHRLSGDHSETVVPQPGVFYQVESQIEVLPAEVFGHVQEDILMEATRPGSLAHEFAPRHRLAPPALSVVACEVDQDYIAVSAFHTFPDELTVVKTQSLIEWTGDGPDW